MDRNKFATKMKNILIIALSACVIITGLGCAYLCNKLVKVSNANSSEPQDPIVITQKQDIIVNIDSMKNSLEDMAALATEEYNFTNVATFTEGKTKVLFISIPFTGKSCLMTYSGVVKAGIKDCSKISVDVNDSKKQIVITCPAVEIFEDPVIDPASIEIYDYSKSVFAPITVEDFAEFEAEEQGAAREQALNSGLLDKAKKSAHDLLCAQANAIIKGSTYNDYYVYVEFEE